MAVAGKDTAAGAGELMTRLCRFAVDEMALSGCTLVLIAAMESASVVALQGRADSAQDVQLVEAQAFTDHPGRRAAVPRGRTLRMT
jgi:hypothetical protein